MAMAAVGITAHSGFKLLKFHPRFAHWLVLASCADWPTEVVAGYNCSLSRDQEVHGQSFGHGIDT